MNEGVGLGLELGAAATAAASFSAKFASCCKLYSCMLVRPWREVATVVVSFKKM